MYTHKPSNLNPNPNSIDIKQIGSDTTESDIQSLLSLNMHFRLVRRLRIESFKFQPDRLKHFRIFVTRNIVDATNDFMLTCIGQTKWLELQVLASDSP